ncbi:MAG: hypothetical protein ABJB34_09725 [Acidobacteriota bacterium]
MDRIFRAFFLGFFLAASVTLAYADDLNMFRKVSDFDGDGRADFAVIRDELGRKMLVRLAEHCWLQGHAMGHRV